MAIDYKKELEDAAKNMILVHEPDTLIRIIVRRIVQRVNVRHAAILLCQKDKDSYILTVSRGASGSKIPVGYARMDTDNPLIRFFRGRFNEKLFHNGVVVEEEIKRLLEKNTDTQTKQILEETRHQMQMLGASVCIPSYFREDLLGILLLGSKNDGTKFSHEELDFFVAIASDVAMAIENARLFSELEQELKKKQKLFFHTTIALAAAIDAKDHYTRGHTARVTAISLAIARALSEKNKDALDEKFLEHLHIASLLHDIGKIGIPETILNKEGPLTAEEKKKIQEHPILGTAILLPIKELQDSIPGVKYHHERYDGSGYPEGLKGNEIPLIAAIIAIADVFDAMTTDRPYRKALSKNEAVAEIRQAAGKDFDPEIADALAKLYQENKI